MTHAPDPTPPDSPTPSKRAPRSIRLVFRAIQVRLRFIVVLAAALVFAGQWDTLRNHWDRLARAFETGGGPKSAVSANVEYFCPMDPVVVSPQPGKCDICNMALVRRKVGDTAPLPSGVLARMQISPYRVQLAGLRTAPVEYQPTAREVVLTGLVRDDGLVECRVPEHDRPFVVAGLAAEVLADRREPGSSLPGSVHAVEVDPTQARAHAIIRLETADHEDAPGTRVVAIVRRPVADLEPFRSQPSDPPPLARGGQPAVYGCPVHPDVLTTDRGRCPVDREYNLQRRTLLDHQRVGWWCPMHPRVTADHPGVSCDDCRGMKLVPRIINYRPTGQVLTVLESAVVDTGSRTSVFVERSPGMFECVEVALGPRCGDLYPVASGLERGQRVAIAGAFLLDAETRLNPSLAAAYFGAARTGRDEPGLPTGSGSVAPGPGVCLVSGRPLGSMGPPVSVTVNGRTVQLCCAGCEARLRESPDKYLPPPESP